MKRILLLVVSYSYPIILSIVVLQLCRRILYYKIYFN